MPPDACAACHAYHASSPTAINARRPLHAELRTDGTKFHAIHVGAAAAEMPVKLRELLAPGGKMLIPIGEAGSRGQALTLVTRATDPQAEPQFETERLMGVAFVPLTAPS